MTWRRWRGQPALDSGRVGLPKYRVPNPSQPLHNARHESFALAVVAGKPGAEAYRDSGYANDKTGANAKRLTNNDQIKARIAWLKAQTATSTVLSQIHKRELLAAIARDPQARASDRIAAIREDNHMSGDGGDQALEIRIVTVWEPRGPGTRPWCASPPR